MEAEKYEVLEKIGHGSFGVIRKVRRKNDGHILCRKEISYLQMSAKEREQLQSELSILKGLRHPNIVAYYEREHIKLSSDLHIYMEYCEYGDLGRYIKELKRSAKMAEEDFVWSVFTQLLTALYRCHYGEDVPDVGRNVIGLGSDAKPVAKDALRAMILHRDLKPENIFLGADSSVKLGDFGLSKIMQSHDFASTYVGTPFYMSPEICAAEQYSLHSDMWAFGCIMYELCAKEPPFNAKTHLELIQKIRLGKIAPLPPGYSTELKDAISRCLRVNPHTRPDTVQLLNIPMVKLKRKELEVVRVGRQLRVKEEKVTQALHDAEERLAKLDSDKQATRTEIEAIVRREWEVKARLEIDRQVQIGIEKLWADFDCEVNRRVKQELRHQQREERPVRSSTPNPSDLPLELQNGNYQHQRSQSTTGEPSDFPSSTDLSELSLESPTLQRSSGSSRSKKNGRTPFARARTMFDGYSPHDITMAEPSPAPIGSLGLSPRQKSKVPSSLGKNIFAAAAAGDDGAAVQSESELYRPLASYEEEEDDADDDEEIILPSPTRQKPIASNPFNAASRRPGLQRQKTAPLKRPVSAASLFSGPPVSKPITVAKENQAPEPTGATGLSRSPSRRISKLPSASNVLALDAANNTKRTTAAAPKSPNKGLNGMRPISRRKEEDIRHAAMVNHHHATNTNGGSGGGNPNNTFQGRTLIELAQARTANSHVPHSTAVQDFADGFGVKGDVLMKDVAVWDPDTEPEMPSPFVRKGKFVNAIGPGFSGLR